MSRRALLLLATLLTIQAYAKIEKRGSFDDIYIQKGEDILVPLQDGYDFTEAVHPLTITSSAGKGYSYLHHIYKKELQNINDIKFAKIFDNNRIAVFHKSKPDITIVEFGGTSRFDKDSFNLLPDFGPRTDFSCEDLTFDSHLRIIIVGCRAPPTEEEKFQTVGIFTFDLAEKGQIKGSWKSSEDETFQIKNRINLSVFRDEDQKEHKGTFNVIMSDSKINNGKDADIDNKIRVFHIKDNIILPNGVVEIPNSAGDLTDLRCFTNFRNQLLLTSRRKESGNKLCFTLLELTHSGYTDFIVKVTDQNKCTRFENGDLISAWGDQIVAYDADPEHQDLFIYQVSDNFRDGHWINEDAAYTVSLKKHNPKGGLRSVHVSPVGVVAKFSQDKGIDDTEGNTYVGRLFSDVSFPITGSQTAVLVNNNYLSIANNELRVYLLAEPHLRINSLELENGSNQIQIKIKDSSEGATEVDGSVTVYVVTDLFDKIELKSEEENKRQPVEIAPGGLYKHIFKYDQIKYGNDVTFEIEYDQAADPKLVPNTRTSISHLINWHPQLASYSDIQKVKIKTGAAIVVDQKNIYWHQCLGENEFETTCVKVGTSSHFGKEVSNKIGAFLEVIYSFEYDQKSGFSYFSWYQIGEGWQYEHYQGRIKDVEIIQSQSGKVYSVLAFDDKIVVSIFYDDWYYGNRNPQTYFDIDVNDFGFCPSEIYPFNEKDGKTPRFAVISNCENDHEAITFIIEDSPEYIPKGEFKLTHIGSIFISNKMEVPEFCYLGNEIVIYAPNERIIYSLDMNYETLSKIPLDMLNASPQEFKCMEDSREFAVLTINRGDKTTQTKEIVVFRGGKQFDVYNRLKTRIRNLDMDVERFEVISQDGDSIFITIDNYNQMKYRRFYESGPELTTQALNDFDQTGTFTFKIKLKNDKTMIESTQQMKVLAKFADIGVAVTKKQTFGKNTFDLTKSLSFTGAVTDIELTPKEEETKVKVINSIMGDTSLEMGDDEVGRYANFGAYDMVATYSLSTRLHYGKVKFFKNRVLKDTYYTPITFNSANFIKADNGDLLTLFVPNYSFQSMKIISNRNEKFSSKTLDLENFGFSCVDVEAFKIPGKTNQFIIFCTSFGTITANIFTYVPNSETLDDWSIVMGENFYYEDFKPSGRYDITQNEKTLNIYAFRRGKDQKAAYRVEFDFATSKFSQAYPIDLGDGDNFSEVVRVSCVNEDKKDRCGFATAGSVVYYAEFNENYQTMDSGSEGQQPPVPTPRNPTFTARLRKKDDFYGEKVRISGRFMILENKRIHKSHARYVAVWDLDLIKRDSLTKLSQQPATTTKDIYVAYVTSLTGAEANFHEGIDCKLLEIRTVDYNGMKVGEMVIQRENGDDQKIFISYKKLLPWSVQVVGDVTGDDMKKYKLKFTGINKKTQEVTFEQLFDAPSVNGEFTLAL